MALPAPGAGANGRRAVSRGAMIAGTTIAVTGGFLFRFLTAEFTNDHFVHLSRGWQILGGDVPVRDFFDPGLILQYYASTLALLWSGHNLFGEALLTTGFIAAGAGFTFIAAARLSRSFWIAMLATVTAIVSTPRLYGYPKVFFYALAIAAAWHYARRPGSRPAALLGLITAVAFLFRHDHGVYISIAVFVQMLILHWGQPRQTAAALAQYGTVTLILLLPFLIFVQSTAGLVRYVGGISPQMQRVSTPQVNLLPIAIDWTAPLLILDPAPDRRVNVRWKEEIDEGTRKDIEGRHHLLKPEHIEETTWSYVLGDESRTGIARLVDDPAVADTHGIDRAARTIDIQEPLYVWMQRWIPLFRLQIAPGILTRDNALAWFYYVTFLLPIVALAMLGTALWRGTIDRVEASVAGMAAVLCLVIVQTLVRGSPDSRLADVANPICIVGAWVAARLLHPAVHRARLSQLAWSSGVCVMAVLTFWCVAADARALSNLDASRILTGPAGIWWRAGVVKERLSIRPIDDWAPDDPGIPGLGRYVFECTAPTDRLFVTWFAPQIFFYAERMFAGGQVYLTPNWHASPEDQQLTIERLEQQRVPIVLERLENPYDDRFPEIYRYVHAHYADAPMTAERMKGFRVLVNRRLTPTGTYEPLGLPCYR